MHLTRSRGVEPAGRTLKRTPEPGFSISRLSVDQESTAYPREPVRIPSPSMNTWRWAARFQSVWPAWLK